MKRLLKVAICLSYLAFTQQALSTCYEIGSRSTGLDFRVFRNPNSTFPPPRPQKLFDVTVQDVDQAQIDTWKQSAFRDIFEGALPVIDMDLDISDADLAQLYARAHEASLGSVLIIYSRASVERIGAVVTSRSLLPAAAIGSHDLETNAQEVCDAFHNRSVYYAASFLAALDPEISNRREPLRAADLKIDDLGITGRRLAIIKRIAQGLSNEAIAEDLGIAAATVKITIHNLLESLHLSSRVQLAILAVQKGLYLPPAIAAGPDGFPLSLREFEVARATTQIDHVDGGVIAETAQLLGANSATVKNQLTSIREKLGVNNMSQIAVAILPLANLSYDNIVAAYAAIEPIRDRDIDRLLSHRQVRIAEMARRHLTNAAIAERLGTSIDAVKRELRAIYTALNINGKSELAAIMELAQQMRLTR